MPAPSKGQIAPETEEFVLEERNSDSEMKSARGVSQPVISLRKLKFRREKAPDKKKRALAPSSRLPRLGVCSRFF